MGSWVVLRRGDAADLAFAAVLRWGLFCSRREALTLLEWRMVDFVKPNVRAEAGPTAKRQARAVENAPARRAGLAF